MIDLQPGRDLDRLFAERVEGYEWRHKGDYAVLLEGGQAWLANPYFNLLPGKGDAERADASGVPPYSTDDATALAALERFAEKHGLWWTVSRMPPGWRDRYIVAIHSDDMHADGGAATLAHAIVLCLLAVVELQERVHV